MSEGSVQLVTGDPFLDDALARMRAAARDIIGFDLDSLIRLDRPSAGLVAAGAAVEAVRRQLAAFDGGYVAALEAAAEPARHGASNTATFLRHQLRISAGAARRRVQMSRACAPRTAMTGPGLPPHCPILAAAIADGLVSDEHTHLVLTALDRLPHQVRQTHGPRAEAQLVAAATTLDPAGVVKAGQHLLDLLDPDGTLRDHRWQHQQRTATLTVNHDGTGQLHARLTKEALAAFRAVLEPAAAPLPAGPDGPDPRTPGQRLHDALHEAMTRLLSAGDAPASGGTPATIVLIIDEHDFTHRTGFAITEHGDLIPAAEAFQLADEALIHTLVTTSKGVPLHLARTSRIATPGQSIALAARDRGCSFPGCDRPPGWTQRHHVIPWAHGGPTDIDNLTLLCGYHHRSFESLGWTCTMTGGRPWWTPPTWIDPTHTPIRNTIHDHAC